MRIIVCALLIAITSVSFPAFAADYEIRKFKEGQWFIYQGEVKTGFGVNSANEPQCYQIGDVLIPLNKREDALNQQLLEDAARNGFQNYHAYCAGKNQQASNTRNVVAFVADGATIDNSGRVTGINALVSGRIVTTGGPADGVLTIKANNVKTPPVDAIAELKRKGEEARVAKLAEEKAEVDALRARFDPQLSRSLSSAKVAGFFAALTGGNRVKMTGAWSGSTAQCEQDALLLIDNGGKGQVEWWRANSSYGMLPWRSGSWSLEDDVVIMVFDHRTEFTRYKGFEDTSMNETVQLNLKNISSDALHLASPGPNSPALKLLDADEKLFVRCPGG